MLLEGVRDCETESKRLIGEIDKDGLHNYFCIVNVTGLITKNKNGTGTTCSKRGRYNKYTQNFR